MDNTVTASQDVHKCLDAVWPYLVQKIGVAVDGDPEKIKKLQQAPYTVLQMQADPTSSSGNVSNSILPSPKTRRNRNPCQECKRKRQKCVRNPADPDTCERCSQKQLSCRLYYRDVEDFADSPEPSSSAFNGDLTITSFGGSERGATTYRSPQEAMHLSFNLTALPAGLDNPEIPSAYDNTLALDAGEVEGQYNQTWVFSSK